jgi:hypothetical protein
MAKPFSFTYSKLKSFETCGRQHEAEAILRLPGMEPSGDAIDYGNRVHKAFEDALGPEQRPLIPAMRHLQYWVDWVKSLPGTRFVEAKWALSRDFQEAEWFGAPWMRLRGDVAVVNRPAKLGWLVDWKTGNRLDEPLQLWLGAAVMFQLFPELELIDSMFVWLKEDDGRNSHECISAETIKREQVGEIWDQLLPRIGTYEEAVASKTFLPKPGRHCRWCKLLTCDARERA